VTAAGIDHILIGVHDLDEGIREFERATGVSPMRGGHHPSRGTENALVSLGEGMYLEIIAPQAAAPPEEFVTMLRAARAPAVVWWAVLIDIKDAVARLDAAGFKASEPRAGSRVTPQGSTLEWITFNVETPRIAGAPFFIQWGAATAHPSLTSPGGCSLTSFTVADPAGDDLSRLLAVLDVRADVRSAEGPHMHLDIRCGTRTVSFRTAE
jgi:hypothetical protein